MKKYIVAACVVLGICIQSYRANNQIELAKSIAEHTICDVHVGLRADRETYVQCGNKQLSISTFINEYNNN